MVYLSANIEAISAILVVKREKKQISFYFVSRVLQGAELNYLIIEKLVLALLYPTRRMKRYF